MDGVKEMIEHPLTHIGIGELAIATPVIILLLTSLWHARHMCIDL